MNRVHLAGAALAAALFLPSAARGGVEPKVALHAEEVSGPGIAVCSTGAPTTLPCSKFTTSAKVGSAYEVYLVVGRAQTVAGLSCGIEYARAAGDGVDVWGWTLCADMEFSNGSWPESGGGDRIVWDWRTDCQASSVEDDGVHAIAGAFTVYAYSPDLMAVTPNMRIQSGPELAVATCGATPEEYDLPLDARGAVRFSESGDEPGYNPCSGEGELPPPPSPPEDDDPPPPPPPPAGDRAAAVLLHLAPGSGEGSSCSGAPTTLEDVVTSAPSAADALYTVYLLGVPPVQDGVPLGLGGIKLGVDVDVPAGSAGIDVLEWQSCGVSGLLRTETWPGPGSGATLIWSQCQTGELAVAGYFMVEVHGPAALVLGEHPVSHSMEIGTCAEGEIVLSPTAIARAGWASIGGAAIAGDADGCNPAVADCPRGTVAVQPSTWGRLKTRY